MNGRLFVGKRHSVDAVMNTFRGILSWWACHSAKERGNCGPDGGHAFPQS
jgi:hypothetical protein